MNDRLYNTKLELGLRCLFILKALYPNICSLDRLLYLDYLSLYIEDFKEDGTNLHPKYPFQTIEVLEKRLVIKKSILELGLKGLIDVETNEGLGYRGNANTLWLIDSIQDNYSEHLMKNIQLVVKEAEFKTEEELKKIIFSHNAVEQNEFCSFYPYNEEE
ncbi:ABC-three component system middle component 2 [Clostridium estertheticum]|uniref:ABC-three component system middle component 2 n=1 Tax=Clostridium estertheticum TaxID=238834 RepID=UPI001CF52229|nr:ABC-three component system middle component 2 [Clostridium estertheticum]MCB2356415.1 hypothetical protein [Clostridium estertheticum]WAG39640.1 hypothetical protein LL065_15235 [Clostridium estertheticum]